MYAVIRYIYAFLTLLVVTEFSSDQSMPVVPLTPNDEVTLADIPVISSSYPAEALKDSEDSNDHEPP